MLEAELMCNVQTLTENDAADLIVGEQVLPFVTRGTDPRHRIGQ